MTSFRHGFCLAFVLGSWFSLFHHQLIQAEEVTPEALEFFEKEVRPLLLSACGKCHGSETQWGSLRVDSHLSLLNGGDSGPAIVPGDPDNSLLIQSVRRTGDYEMPPDEPLSDEQIAVLEKWVQIGAPWPEGEGLPENEREELFRNHWAFQPVSKPRVPEVSDPDWCQTPIDRFVLAKLEENNLVPSPAADKRTLIRRVSYHLTGLPPSPEDVEAFVNDAAPEAYEKLVDRLLDSPQFGEKMARRWLDLARYSDTKGYVYGREESRFVHSALYRDWVIQAFNDDLPYDQFLLKQLAADQVAPADSLDQAATGFITLSRRFLGNTPDIIDDRMDVIGRTTLGMTFGCARCHDHKFDPIPIDDYYGLYGVLKNNIEELTPLCDDSPSSEEKAAFQKELQAALTDLEEGIAKASHEAAERVRARIKDYLAAQLQLENYPGIGFSQILYADDVIPSFVHRWESYLRKADREKHPVFVVWHRLAALPEDDFSSQAAGVLDELRSLPAEEVNTRVLEQFATAPASMKDVTERYGDLLLTVHNEWKALVTAAEESGSSLPLGFEDANSEAVREVLYGPESPCEVPAEGIVGTEFYYDIGTTVQLWGLQSAVDKLLINSPNAPPYAVVLRDSPVIDEPRVFRRGNPMSIGHEVPRQLPVVIAGEEATPFQIGSGRLELAKGIIDQENPLTPRVWVNRLWAWSFGSGIVATPSDFGTRAPEPEHLDLLDWLAQKLIEENWSTKEVLRLIVLSSAYQQQSTGPELPEFAERALLVDSENKFYWRTNVHRLTFEEMRDSLLTTTSELDLSMGGRGSPLFASQAPNYRRTLYGYIDRQFLPDVFRVFDFASPDLHIPTRSETMIPQQALFAINHPFIAERAKALVAVLETHADTDEGKIDYLFQRLFQRLPTSDQKRAVLSFLEASVNEDAPKPRQEPLAWQYGYGSVSVESGKTQDFNVLPHFTGTTWQGGNQVPDPQLGWVYLDATGGHPGNNEQFAAIRRWTAPHSMTVNVESTVIHEPPQGNGIRCRIVSSSHGILSEFELHASRKEEILSMVEMQAGETIDFVVDINGNLHSDQFLWNVSITDVADKASEDGSVETPTRWNSQNDFTAQAIDYLTPWEQLAQVMLLSNEFLFID